MSSICLYLHNCSLIASSDNNTPFIHVHSKNGFKDTATYQSLCNLINIYKLFAFISLYLLLKLLLMRDNDCVRSLFIKTQHYKRLGDVRVSLAKRHCILSICRDRPLQCKSSSRTLIKCFASFLYEEIIYK